MIYILFPTHTEFYPITGSLRKQSKVEAGRRPGLAGILHGIPVTALVSGVGQANTAQAMAAILEDGRAELIVLGGCAGAYRESGLAVGDVALATEEVYADIGVQTPDGWVSLEEIALPILEKAEHRYFNRFPLKGENLEKALHAARDVRLTRTLADAEKQPRVFSGPFLTVSAVSGTAERGAALRERFGALCENMEGAAAAHVALLYDTPFLEVRGISNMVEDRDRDRWDIATASANCVKVIEDIVKSL